MRIFCISSGGIYIFFSRYQAMLVMYVFKIQKGEQVMKLEEAENFEQLEGKDLEEQAGDMDFDEELVLPLLLLTQKSQEAFLPAFVLLEFSF